METPPINTAVSPAFDPVTYLSVEGCDDSTRGYIDDVIGFANDMSYTLGKLHDARKFVDGNDAWTEAQKILVMSKEADKHRTRLAARLDRTMRDLDARIGQVESDLARPLEARALGTLNAEVRAHVKGLERAEREKLIREAMEADDEDTLASVLGCPPFLSGVTAVDHAHHVRTYHERRNPHLVARLNLMVRVRDMMNKNGANGPAFHRAWEKVVGAPPGRVSAIAKASRLAEEALNIEPTA